jgi:SAM-dependent methyltransferase
MFENLHLDADTKAAALALLDAHGYEHISDGMDTLGVRRTTLERHHDLARLWRTLPAEQLAATPPPAPLASRLRGRARRELERLLARRGYSLAKLPPDDRPQLVDHSVPLPPGAEERLRADSPRLRELCAAYEALDWPVVTHSRWQPELFEHWLDLRYFRGDNAYIWHYRETEEVSRLRFFVYLNYVEGLDTDDILSRITEDGAFGCFTYDFPGHPICSRDLLDSACELAFLDRHLSIRGATDLRVLDIGAGYGRLAHRTIEAVKGIADYCCVDAVPHSTFLSEYYLEARGVAPPGRVVALPDVPSLDPGAFDLAMNVHSFSECTLDAITWWLAQLARLEVPHLFLVPNEPEGFLSLETDGRRLDAMPALEAAGYRLVAEDPAILDDSVRAVLDVHDRHCLFTRVT